jgi:Tfp pilus assembly protein PilF
VGLLENLEAMLAAGQDNALLRFTLGSELLKQGKARLAADHLREAVLHDPEYSAAWKIYGRALHALNDFSGACDAYERGIETAQRKGDIQAAREMRVFLKRAQNAATDNSGNES